MQTMSGPVINGGLIDFQDNFHRGMAEYANYQQAQQQLAGMMGGLPSSFPMQQQAFQPMQQFQAHPSLAGGSLPGVPATSQLPCISGPPAFLHVHGQTYVPVEAQPPVVASASKPASVEATPEPAPRVLSEEEIERRVRDRVDAWAASQRKPVYTVSSAAADSRRHLKGRAVSDEERAAERINSVNAGMRGRFCSPF